MHATSENQTRISHEVLGIYLALINYRARHHKLTRSCVASISAPGSDYTGVLSMIKVRRSYARLSDHRSENDTYYTVSMHI